MVVNQNISSNILRSKFYVCPVCGNKLTGSIYVQKKKNSVLHYKKYRCGNNRRNITCHFNKTVSENTMEKMLLANIEKYLNDAKIRSVEISDNGEAKIPKYDIQDLHEQIDRLNYSWQTGKIRKVEQYEKDYAELMEKLALAEAEQNTIEIKDFSRIEGILEAGWKEIYKALDDEHKRAFWRSFIKSIEINWTTEKKEIVRVNFF